MRPAIVGQNLSIAAILGGSLLGWGVGRLWWLVAQLWHTAQCPPNAFFTSGPDVFWSPCALGFAACLAVITAVWAAMARSDRGREAFAAWSPDTPVGPTVRVFGKGAAAVFVLFVVLAWTDFTSVYCLTPDTVIVQRSIVAQRRAYRWSDVRIVRTACQRVKNNERNVWLDLIMADGLDLSLPEYRFSLPGTPTSVPYFAGLSAGLQGVPYRFDRSAIEPKCTGLGPIGQRP